jgi:hypothetical protein
MAKDVRQFQLMPPLCEDEYAALGQSIADRATT